MQYASWILLFALLVASVLGLFGFALEAVVIGGAIAMCVGFLIGLGLNLAGAWLDARND